MVIELLGIPGCGKTTFAEKYVKDYDAINPLCVYLYNTSRIKQNFNKVLLMGEVFRAIPRESFKILKLFNAIHFSSAVKKLKMMLYLYSILGVIIRSQENYIDRNIILDEGINQVIWGLLYNSKNSERNVLFLQQNLTDYFGDVIYIFNIDTEVIKENLRRRTQKGGAELKTDIDKDNSCLIRAIEILGNVRMGILKNKPECEVAVIGR